MEPPPPANGLNDFTLAKVIYPNSLRGSLSLPREFVEFTCVETLERSGLMLESRMRVDLQHGFTDVSRDLPNGLRRNVVFQ